MLILITLLLLCIWAALRSKEKIKKQRAARQTLEEPNIKYIIVKFIRNKTQANFFAVAEVVRYRKPWQVKSSSLQPVKLSDITLLSEFSNQECNDIFAVCSALRLYS